MLEMLREDPGVAHLTRAPGAAVKPEGDVIGADVAREALDDLLAKLCEHGVDVDGGITVERVDTTISRLADQAQADAPGDPTDAVVWEELMAHSGDESRLTATFVAFLCLALLLAAVGVVTDSPVTVVGAMVVGPEFGPLAAVAVGLVARRFDLVRRAAGTVLVGFPVAMLVCALGSFASESLGLVTEATLGTITQVDFIYQVGPFSLVVALLAGAAGMLSLVSDRSAVLVGVFISVTTVPAAGFAVVAATLGQWGVASQSALQLLVNLVGIVVAATVVLALRQRARGPATHRALAKG
ncbi:DUF389 domain-containing protein [Rhodococcus aerolatus]